MKRIPFFSIILFVLSGCSGLGSIPYYPEQTPESWLQIQPFMDLKIGGIEFVLIQPSSTIFVYTLGILTIFIGLYFFRIKDNEQSRKWWGIALVLWGLGAIFAGTSYQAFSYEIKCAGKAICSWTSWWEIVYLVLSVASIDAILISGAYSSSKGIWRKVILYCGILKFTLYSVLVAIGILTLNEFLISFELLLFITAPNILFLFILNGRRYFKYRNEMDFSLLKTWIWLGLTIGAYFIYLIFDVTEIIWNQGIWFSENDVLHIGLIGWMLYIRGNVAKRVRDEQILEFG